MSKTTGKNSDVRFGERAIGSRFEADLGGMSWMAGEKVGPFEFRRADGAVVGMSYWTKTRDEGRPLIEVLGDE
jgi:hypothetical protein